MAEVTDNVVQLLSRETATLRFRYQAQSAAIVGRTESGNLHQVLSSLPASVSETIQREFDITKSKFVEDSNSAFEKLNTLSDDVGRSIQDR